MRKNVLALSIATLIGGLGLAGGASASVFADGRTADQLQINNDGIGHILLVPYYTAQGSNVSVMTLVNTDTTAGKVLKVRYRGAGNSDDVFDFTLFLSPGDVWSGGVSNVNGRAALSTEDNSCVLPSDAGINSGTPISFVTSRLGAAGNAGTLEGYVEVLNVADVPYNTTTGSLYNAIKHVNGVAPCFTGIYAPLVRSTGQPSLALNPDTVAQARALGLDNPSGSLFGNWTIINVANVASWGGDATAVAAIDSTTLTLADGNIVFYPQVNDAVAASELNNTSDPLLAFEPAATSGLVTARMYDFPDLSTPYVTDPGTKAAAVAQANFLTGALAVTSVKNEYITSDTVVGDTDWVFSMPTRRYHAAVNYVTQTIATNAGFTSPYFTSSNIYLNTTAARKALAGESVICVRLAAGTLSYFDRSERAPAADRPPFVISPSDPIVVPALEFCGEASVLAFNSETSQVLGASIGRNSIALNEGFDAGWASINTSSLGLGLPILGSAFQKFINQGASGVMGNFGSVWPHRGSRVAQP